jgi:WD40 repeat protein
VIVCLSRQSVGKEGYLQREIREALNVAEEKPEGTIFIIPVRIEEVDVPRRLSRWQWANLFEQDGYGRLLLALNRRASAIGLTPLPVVTAAPGQPSTKPLPSELERVAPASIEVRKAVPTPRRKEDPTKKHEPMELLSTSAGTIPIQGWLEKRIGSLMLCACGLMILLLVWLLAPAPTDPKPRSGEPKPTQTPQQAASSGDHAPGSSPKQLPSSAQLVLTLRGHTARVWTALFSSDGKRIITAAEDRTARVWDAASGQILTTLKGNSSMVWSAAISPDSRYIVTADWNDLRVWDFASGRLLQARHGGLDDGFRVAISADSQRMITAADRTTALVLNIADGRTIDTMRGHDGTMTSGAFSPDSRRIVTADKTAEVWDAVSGKLLTILQTRAETLLDAEFSPDSRRIVTAGWDHTAEVWDADSGQRLMTLRGHTAIVRSAVYSPDGQVILTASEDHTARVWNAATGQQLFVLRDPNELNDGTFSPDGKRIVTASGDHSAKIWQLVY